MAEKTLLVICSLKVSGNPPSEVKRKNIHGAMSHCTCSAVKPPAEGSRGRILAFEGCQPLCMACVVLEKGTVLQDIAKRVYWNQEAKFFSLAVSLLCSLSTSVLVGKGKSFKELRSIFTEQTSG